MTQRRIIWGLFAVFLLLIGMALALPGLERAGRSTPMMVAQTQLPTVPPDPFVFPEVYAHQITQLEVRFTAVGRTIILNKVPGSWVGREGERPFTPDLTKIPDVLRVLAGLRYNRQIDRAEVEEFGLKDGGMVVVQFIANGKPYRLALGGNNPDQTITYIQTSGDGPVLFVSASQAAILSRALQSLEVQGP